MSTFTVTDVDPTGKPLSPPQPLPILPESAERNAWRQQTLGRRSGEFGRCRVTGVEHASAAHEGVVKTVGAMADRETMSSLMSESSDMPMLMEAVYAAFFRHMPLRLSPDAVWLTIIHGVSVHVNAHAEELRAKFVAHEGRKTLVVERPDLVVGQAYDGWDGVISEFCEKVEENLVAPSGVTASFSTTTRDDEVAGHVILMDTVQQYFKFLLLSGCGIPKIELRGTPDDWRLLREKAAGFERLGLGWWLEELLPALDQFVAAASGSPDPAFWRAMVNKSGASASYGGPVSGWAQVFYPYLRDGSRNRGLGQWRRDEGGVEPEAPWSFGTPEPPRGFAVKGSELPPTVSAAPLTVKNVLTGEECKMMLVGGLSAVTQTEEDGVPWVEPVSGWAVLRVEPREPEAPQLAAEPMPTGVRTTRRNGPVAWLKILALVCLFSLVIALVLQVVTVDAPLSGGHSHGAPIVPYPRQ